MPERTFSRIATIPPVLSLCFLYYLCTLVENQTTIGMIRTSGAKRINARVDDIQNIIANAVPNVVAILIILVLASEIISSSCATSAERTDMRFPDCLFSKYDASMANKEFVASILMSCCALYAVDCHSWLLNPWKTARNVNESRISNPNPNSIEFIGPREGIQSELTKSSTRESVNVFDW